MKNPTFSAGRNIALKVPPHEFDNTIKFYKDILGFDEVDSNGSDSRIFKFGDKHLWIDKTPGISQAEIWLEIKTDNMKQASSYLKQMDCIRQDEIEPLPKGFQGFWISNPANIIHLITQK